MMKIVRSIPTGEIEIYQYEDTDISFIVSGQGKGKVTAYVLMPNNSETILEYIGTYYYVMAAFKDCIAYVNKYSTKR